jgi:hypothetical protein
LQRAAPTVQAVPRLLFWTQVLIVIFVVIGIVIAAVKL